MRVFTAPLCLAAAGASAFEFPASWDYKRNLLWKPRTVGYVLDRARYSNLWAHHEIRSLLDRAATEYRRVLQEKKSPIRAKKLSKIQNTISKLEQHREGIDHEVQMSIAELADET